ncbi:hypothetical protein D3C81_1197060 [compost metagenome]
MEVLVVMVEEVDIQKELFQLHQEKLYIFMLVKLDLIGLMLENPLILLMEAGLVIQELQVVAVLPISEEVETH